MRPAGGNHALFRKYVDQVWQIPTEHFDPHAASAAQGRRRATPLEDMLVEGSTCQRRALKRRLFEAGIKRPQCEMCGQGEIWNGQRISLILDHINGVPDDNRLENLRIVCPNCAATLETHCARKNKLDLVYECHFCKATFRPAYRKQRFCSKECSHSRERAGRPNYAARKVARPPFEELLAEIAATSYSAVGRKYGVSHVAVRKWVEFGRRAQERAQRDSGEAA